MDRLQNQTPKTQTTIKHDSHYSHTSGKRRIQYLSHARVVRHSAERSMLARATCLLLILSTISTGARAHGIQKITNGLFPHHYRGLGETYLGRAVFKNNPWQLKSYIGLARLVSTSDYVSARGMGKTQERPIQMIRLDGSYDTRGSGKPLFQRCLRAWTNPNKARFERMRASTRGKMAFYSHRQHNSLTSMQEGLGSRVLY